MTSETPHDEAGAAVTARRTTGAATGHDSWRSRARLLKIRDVSLFVEVRGRG